mmetsp:Transcript_57253/g.174318  ORF Transcript_57253/g.174318 Transcript_57253/m.174318 type:complete len:224 (+) Transcript_57253:649-1320(+)
MPAAFSASVARCSRPRSRSMLSRATSRAMLISTNSCCPQGNSFRAWPARGTSRNSWTASSTRTSNASTRSACPGAMGTLQGFFFTPPPPRSFGTLSSARPSYVSAPGQSQAALAKNTFSAVARSSTSARSASSRRLYASRMAFCNGNANKKLTTVHDKFTDKSAKYSSKTNTLIQALVNASAVSGTHINCTTTQTLAPKSNQTRRGFLGTSTLEASWPRVCRR